MQLDLNLTQAPSFLPLTMLPCHPPHHGTRTISGWWGATGVIISNHISWSDILIHLEGYFCSFVARSNTQDMPFIGLISCALCDLKSSMDFKACCGSARRTAVGCTSWCLESIHTDLPRQ